MPRPRVRVVQLATSLVVMAAFFYLGQRYPEIVWSPVAVLAYVLAAVALGAGALVAHRRGDDRR